MSAYISGVYCAPAKRTGSIAGRFIGWHILTNIIEPTIKDILCPLGLGLGRILLHDNRLRFA